MIRKTSDAKPKSIRCENKEIEKNNRSQTENLSATAEEEVTMVSMQNQTQPISPTESGENSKLELKIHPQRRRKK